jgi:hypothetical protein
LPVTPGILPVLVVDSATGLSAVIRRFRPGMENVVLAVLASLTTAAVVYALTLLAGRSRPRRAFAATLGFLWSAFSTLAMTVIVVGMHV